MKLKPTTLAMILAGGRVDELTVLTLSSKIRHTLRRLYQGHRFSPEQPDEFRSGTGRHPQPVPQLFPHKSYRHRRSLGHDRPLPRHIHSAAVHRVWSFQWYRGSSDAIYQNLDFVQYINPEQLLILSGDHIYRMDYRELISYHREKDADLTMACIRVPTREAHRFGLADIDDEDGELGGRVVRYREKPANPEFNWASLTVFCFKPEVLYRVLEANIKEDASYEFGRDIIPRMMNDNRRVYGYKFKGYWGYTRTIEEYWQTNMDLLGPDPKIKFANWGIRTNLEHRGIRDCQPLKIGNSARISDSLIYNGCIIEGEVERSILFPGTHVEKGARVKDSVLFFKNVVSKEAMLDKVISDVNTTFGRGVRIGTENQTDTKAASVIGWNNFIKANTIIGSGCTIYPALPSDKIPKQVESGEVIR